MWEALLTSRISLHHHPRHPLFSDSNISVFLGLLCRFGGVYAPELPRQGCREDTFLF